MLNQALVSGDAKGYFERAGKVARGKSAFARNIREPNPAMHVLMKKFCRSSLLPRRKASVGMPRRFLEYTVSLDEMRSEDETELIEGKRGRSVAPPEERKNALRYLGHNEIVFEHCQTIVIYSAKTEILGNII